MSSWAGDAEGGGGASVTEVARGTSARLLVCVASCTEEAHRALDALCRGAASWTVLPSWGLAGLFVLTTTRAEEPSWAG